MVNAHFSDILFAWIDFPGFILERAATQIVVALGALKQRGDQI